MPLPLVCAKLPGAFLCLLATTSAWAVDLKSTVAPLEIQDAEPAEAGSRSLETRLRYQRKEDGKGEWLLQPQVKFGLAGNMQLDLGSRVLGGQASHAGSGDLSLRLLYRFREGGTERGGADLAVSLRAELPSGTSSAGVDTEARLIAGTALGGGARAYLNLIWQHEAATPAGRRENRYGGMLGYATALSERTALVSNLVLRQHRVPGKLEGIVEMGVRRIPAKDLVFGAGLGAGVNRDAPRYTFLLSLEQAF